MNGYFVAAGVLLIVIGLVHSVLGERLIFRRMRSGGLIPTLGGQLLLERHVRILWATWHIVTVLAGAIATLLFWLALPASGHLAPSVVTWAVGASLLLSSLLVLVGTRGNHPGWAGLLGTAILVALGMVA